ncbi:hypothetical protein DFP72DRAFT_1170601 [Ephemerocybe angulata]|uniref:Uncharacterized protein n=1 Tax=Ephemerocybe angulata TaxID=980116 RepID=A0A8H6HWT0_9AGAR|nr:hypothetical protein DFP72DRAFT_1170601 [Tulosesus angulatus]
MKLDIASLFGVVMGSSYLLTSAYAYVDYDDLDVRSSVDYHSERDLGFDAFDARSTLDVPFHPSLRAFLEDAAAAHARRALFPSKEAKPGRTPPLRIKGGKTEFDRDFWLYDKPARIIETIQKDPKWIPPSPGKKIVDLQLGMSDDSPYLAYPSTVPTASSISSAPSPGVPQAGKLGDVLLPSAWTFSVAVVKDSGTYLALPPRYVSSNGFFRQRMERTYVPSVKKQR